MRKQKKRYTILAILMVFLLTLYPVGPPAYAWSDSGLTDCSIKQLVTISNFVSLGGFYLGVWDVQISGAVSGTGKAVFINTQPNGGGNGYNFISSSSYSSAARAFNGEPSFVTSRVGSIESTISWGSGSQKRTYIRRFAELCGATVTGYSHGVVYVQTTPYPSAQISPPSTIKAGERVKIAISGTSFVPSGSQSQSIDYKFYVDSSLVDSGSGNKSFSKQVSYTFPTAKTYTLRLDATDGVGRTTTVTKTVTVVAGAKPPTLPPGGGTPPPPPDPDPLPPIDDPWEPPPPPPPPPEPENIPPVARFSLPSECSPGQTVNVRNLSYDPDGYIVDVDWKVSPSSGVAENTLGDNGGTLVFDKLGTYTVKLTVTDNDGDSDSDSDEIEVVNEPPKARIVAPESCMQGEDVAIYSASYDRDGEIVETTWSITPSDYVVGEPGDKDKKLYFDKEGEYKITLTVKDNWGATDTAEHTITVEPAIPKAFFTDEGAHKQNRLIVLTEEGVSPARYPIVKEQNEWEIMPVGNGATAEAIIVKDISPDRKQVLFKTPGTYKVRLKVTNTAGHTSEWYERTLDIRPDEPPVADFVVQQAYLRDLANGKKATVEIRDTSYSPDGDIIAHRTWKYRYDSNNDGDFNDEQWVVFSDGNETAPCFQTDQVGKYQVELEVTEGFGEDTIAEFVSAEDYLKDDTSDKPLDEKRTEVINVRPSVGFDVLPKKKADIIFTVGDTEGTGFDADIVQYLNGLIDQYLKPELTALNVDYTIETMETSTISTNDVDVHEIFNNWINYPDDSGQWQLHQVDGTTVIGTTQNVGWTGFWYPDDAYDVEIEYRQKETTIDDDTMGFTFRMTHQDGKYSFYAFLMDQGGMDQGEAHPSGLYKAVNLPDNFSTLPPVNYGPYNGGYYGRVQDTIGGRISRTDDWEHIKIAAVGNNIKVWYNGTKVIDYTDPDPLTKGGYGPMTYSQAYGYFKDIRISTGRGKTLDEVLRQSSWREDAQRFLVNISAAPYIEFSDPVKSSYIYSRLLNDRIDFSVLGSTANQSQATAIIARNDGQGTFILNSNRNTTMQQLTTYIIDRLNALYPPVENYVLLNEEVYYKTYYNDPEEDPKMAERWKYSHDPAYFENGLGLASFHEQWLPAPVYRFDKVGEFVTTFQARDNPKDDDRFDEYRLWSYMPADSLHLYVHRRPVAMFGVQLSLNGNHCNVTINSDAYDLDHISQPDKGVVEHKWSWRPATNVGWNSGKPATLAKDNDYLIRYEVRDVEGVWSHPVIKLVSTRNVNMAPVAQFTVTPNPVVVDKTITITDLSYDPNGDPIAQRQWRVKPPGGAWGSVTDTPPTKFTSVGEWTVELKVSDGSLWSEPFYQTVQVIPDNTPPVARFTVTPNPVYDCDPVTYTDTSYDPDGDPIVARQWRIRKDGGRGNTSQTHQPYLTALAVPGSTTLNYEYTGPAQTAAA